MTGFEKLCDELQEAIKKTYEEGVTMDDAERLAAKFLYAQMAVSQELTSADLDARMKKTGLKSIKAAVYMKAAASGEKKPTEAMLSSIIDSDETVGSTQDMLDTSESHRDELERFYGVFREGHIYMRGIAKGRFD